MNNISDTEPQPAGTPNAEPATPGSIKSTVINPGASTPTSEIGDEPGGINTVLSDWLVKFAAGGLILMTAIIGWQVFGRFVLNSSPSWSEQAALILMIWYILFAAAAGFREGFHIRIALFESGFSLRNARRIRMAIDIVSVLFGLIIFIYGLQLVYLVWEHTIPALGLPRGVAYIPLPISGFLIMLFSLGHIRMRWKRLQNEGAE